MIPKTIHYCWFGGNPLPNSAKLCINSWKKYLPDYEIKEWNESNFNVNAIPYTAEAYAAGKYAFVSDYARFVILYEHGGLYFDTDVEVIKPLDDIIARGGFMGREAGSYLNIDGRTDCLAVAPGLGLGVEAHHPLYKEFLDAYDGVHFKNEDGSLNMKTIVVYATEILCKHGLNSNNEEMQPLDDLWVYPADVFCPMDHTKGNILKITDRTVSIHHYDCSWMDHNTWAYRTHLLKNKLIRLFGPKVIGKIADIIKGRA